MKIELDRELASAAAKDAANRNMRKHGRDCWNDEDYAIACDTFNRLWPLEREIERWRQIEAANA